jgi:NhaA family Na+:H+ antiporter
MTHQGSSHRSRTTADHAHGPRHVAATHRGTPPPAADEPRARGLAFRATAFAVEYLLMLPLGALVALIWVNVAPESYFPVVYALAFWVNEVAMVFFFGLITKEIVEATAIGGVLHPWRRAALPVVAATGAAAVPALLYVPITAVLDARMLAQAWPVTLAMDVALIYFVARLVFGREAMVTFLLLLALAGNAFGFLALALLQVVSSVRLVPLVALMSLAVAVAGLLRARRVASAWPYIAAAGTLSWAALYIGGIHPALALVPILPFLPHATRDPGFFVDARPGARDTLNRFELWARYPAQVALFFFGLVNAGVTAGAVEAGFWAVPLSTLAGRPAGVFAGVAVALAVGLHLPQRVTWRELLVGALLTASGFSMALFFASARLPPGQLLAEAKMGSLLSVMAAPAAIVAARLLGVGRYGRGES